MVESIALGAIHCEPPTANENLLIEDGTIRAEEGLHGTIAAVVIDLRKGEGSIQNVKKVT